MSSKSSGDKIGCSKYKRRHWCSLGSKMLASGPIGQAKDMTIRSRKGSMGGFVTYRTNILIHSKYKELIELDLYLSEKLLKIFVEQRLEFRETCQWRIISHRSQRFFPVDIKRERKRKWNKLNLQNKICRRQLTYWQTLELGAESAFPAYSWKESAVFWYLQMIWFWVVSVKSQVLLGLR